MKNLIRKWLGIEQPKATASKADPITDCDIRRMVGKAVLDALDGRKDFEPIWGVSDFKIKSTLERCVERLASNTAKMRAEEAIRERIDSEKFIDEVIDRINRKQIKEKQ